ncbi:MAG TPA: DNA polymerase I [Clostridiaceae bacterium]
MEKEKMIILDCNSLLNRAFYALPPLTNSEGIHTNAIYGFLNMLIKMKEQIKPDFIVATFDRKAPTFRHEEYAEYKAGRKKMPPELAEQLPLTKEILKLLTIDVFEIDGFEADDLIGTLAVYGDKNNIEVFVITGDRDALQLATDNVKVILTKKGMSETEIYNGARILDEMKITPSQFIDVKGLMGDASDNIPGVPGIGEKTAFKLIQSYGSIENLLNKLEELPKSKMKENLITYSEQAVFSKRLATIITDVPVEINLDSLRSKEDYNHFELKRMFLRLQFNSLLDKFKSENGEAQDIKESLPLIQIISSKSLVSLISGMSKEVILYYKLEKNILYSGTNLLEIGFITKGKYYNIGLINLEADEKEKIIKELKIFFEDSAIDKIGFDFKGLLSALLKYNIVMHGHLFDIKLAAYLIDSTRGDYEIKPLAAQYLLEDIVQGNSADILCVYSKLYPILKLEIDKLDMKELLFDLEEPLEAVLATMEAEGFLVDKTKLDSLGVKFQGEIQRIQKEIYEFAGEEFNISSPKQLGKILFDKLDLPVIKKTKTGYSTNAEVLEELTDKHPIISLVTYYRQLTKLFSTYIEGLRNVIDVDGKIHSSFNQTVTTTGRLSSTEPNLQNIPIKYELGREIRKVFVPCSKDAYILSADYSQIELRVLAHISKDTNLINAFIEELDIHTKTASEVFKIPLGEVTKIQRSRAKAVNFGIVYGIGDFSLAKDLKISKAEANLYIHTYFDRYPNVKKYMEDIVVTAKKNGFVETIFKRRRLIPEINNSNKMTEAFGVRLAMNTPIQGSAADIVKIAMIRVNNSLKKEGLKSKLLLQVHDELILNVEKDEIDKVKTLVKYEMENAVKLEVPLVVDIVVGETWYEAK